MRGMRNPLESWSKNDTCYGNLNQIIIGENDLTLAQKLIKAGSDHSKFLRQIFVSCDITAPLYWWKEMDTYKIGTTANSTSTMHKITSTKIDRSKYMLDDYSEKGTEHDSVDRDIDWVQNTVISYMECLRRKYLESKDDRYWKALIQLNPQAWEQTRTWSSNYAVIRNIYHARKNHKLKEEWVDIFCNWVKQLPYAKELIINE